MKVAYKTVALLFLGIAQVASAHEDTPLQLSRSGTIDGIPSPFRLLHLDVKGLGTPDARVTLSVGKRVTTLLPCAMKHLRALTVDDVVVSGSWYHEPGLIPYYVNIQFVDAWRPPYRTSRSYYSLLFNLTAAEFIQASREVWEGRDHKYEQNPFELDCAVAVSEVRDGGEVRP
jgi:hypothetical protein